MKQFGMICLTLLIHFPKKQTREQKNVWFCFASALNAAKTPIGREKTAKNVEKMQEGRPVASEKQLLVHEYEHEH